MKLEKVLENLESLLSSWGIAPSDWILVSQYAYRLLGYRVKFRKGHFNILVRTQKIPWKIKEGIEVHPPINSPFREDFRKFIAKTKFDFDINLASDKDFIAKRGKFEIYTLTDNKKIQVQRPIGAIKEFEKLMALSTKEGFGTERLDKDIHYIKDMIRVLSIRKEKETEELFVELLKKFLFAKKKQIGIKNKLVSDRVKGIVAYKGKVTGKVVIVRGLKGSETLSTGDILVTKMTSPSLTTILPKISAIVTDQGGMLSHAAILAREMKVPCIVGTQNATNLLKNGDFVEVDAVDGIVRKLKNEQDL